MQVYAVWAYDQYYPTGPGDLKGLFADENEADALVLKIKEERDVSGFCGPDYIKITKETVG